MKRFASIMLALLAIAPAASVASPQQELDALLTNYRIAWEKADAGELANLYTPDAELADSRAIVQGIAQIKQLYLESFSNGLTGSKLQTRTEMVILVAPGVLHGRGVSRISLAAQPDGQPGQSFCGRFFATLRHAPAGWRIAAFNEVPLACETAFR